MATLEINRVRGPEHIALVTAMVLEFFDYLKSTFVEERAEIQSYLAAHSIEAEVADLPRHFNPPAGECLLGLVDGQPLGIVMLSRVTDRLCELNRMWVRPAGRGRGLARALCTHLMDDARAMGFAEIRLEALNNRITALPLYASLGFEADPYPSDYARARETVVSLRRAL